MMKKQQSISPWSFYRQKSAIDVIEFSKEKDKEKNRPEVKHFELPKVKRESPQHLSETKSHKKIIQKHQMQINTNIFGTAQSTSNAFYDKKCHELNLELKNISQISKGLIKINQQMNNAMQMQILVKLIHQSLKMNRQQQLVEQIKTQKKAEKIKFPKIDLETDSTLFNDSAIVQIQRDIIHQKKITAHDQTLKLLRNKDVNALMSNKMRILGLNRNTAPLR